MACNKHIFSKDSCGDCTLLNTTTTNSQQLPWLDSVQWYGRTATTSGYTWYCAYCGYANIGYENQVQICSNYNCINIKKKEKTIMASAVDFVKRQALKLTNPDEFELREAGLHGECGDLTESGKALMQIYLEELVKEKLVAAAKDINADKKEKKKE